MGRFLQIAGLIVCLAGLVLQACITIPASMEAGRGFLGSIVFLFSFFAILTNIGGGAGPCLAAVSLRAMPGCRLCRAARCGLASAVSITNLSSSSMRQGPGAAWQPQGLFLLCERAAAIKTLRDPGAVRAVVAGGRRRRQDTLERHFLVDAYPIAYLAYRWPRAPIAGKCPTRSSTLAKNGVVSVALAALAVTGDLLVLCILAVLADKGVSRLRAPGTRRDDRLQSQNGLIPSRWASPRETPISLS